jgi:hypothetical protein
MYVEEANRSWCSSNSENDHRAITIEVANDQPSDAGNWHVSDKALASLINLCVDICKRNGIAKLNFTGDKTGNLTMHKYFASTACPGPYLASKFSYIASEVNKRLGSSTTTTTTTTDTKKTTTNTNTTTTKTTTTSSTGTKYKVTANVLNIRAGAGTSYKIVGTVKKNGVYTIMETKNGFGKLKSGAGWVSMSYMKKV